MAKMYYLKFGNGKASNNTGLTPTFTIFSLGGVTSIAAPGITETPASSGLYQYYYSPTMTAVVFEADGGSSLDSSARYIYGTLDALQNMNETVTDFSDSVGSTGVDPTTLKGYLKRNLELDEGTMNFNKSTGVWDRNTRGGTLLRENTLTNTTTEATRS